MLRSSTFVQAACAGLVFACSKGEVVSHPAQSRATLRWSPSLQEPSDERDQRRLLRCDARACTALLTLPDACPVYESGTSESGAFAAVWYKCPPGAAVIEVFSLGDSSKVARFRPETPLDDPERAGINLRADMTWTAGDNLLFEWGAGTSVAEGLLYSATGATLASLSSAALFVSKERRYAVGIVDPFAPDGHLKVLVTDLATGVEEPRTVDGLHCVTDGTWSNGLALECTHEGRKERALIDPRPSADGGSLPSGSR